MSADDGLEVAIVERLDDRVVVGRLGGVGRVRPSLDRRVGIEHVAFGGLPLLVELVDDRLGFLVLTRVRREGHQRALAGIAGDRPVLVGDQRVAGHDLGRHALLFHLTGDQTGFGVIAADVDEIDFGLLHLGDECRVVLFAGRVRLFEGRFHARLFEVHLGLVGETLAIGRLVVDDGDLGVGEILDDVGRSHFALLVITTADAEDAVTRALVGEVRIGRRRGDLDDLLVGINLAGRDRRARTEVARNEGDALGCERVGHGDGLLGVAGVVTDR